MVTVLRRKKYERIIYSRPVVLLLIILLVVLSRAVIGVYEKAQSTEENLVEAEIELEKLDERGDLLEARLESLGTEKGVEAEIREKFNVVRDGENVIMLLEPEEIDSNIGKETKKSFWERIKSLFRR